MSYSARSIAQRQISDWATKPHCRENSSRGSSISHQASMLPLNLNEQRRHTSSVMTISLVRYQTLRGTDAMKNKFIEAQLQKSKRRNGLDFNMNLEQYRGEGMNQMDKLRQKSMNMRLILARESLERERCKNQEVTESVNKEPLSFEQRLELIDKATSERTKSSSPNKQNTNLVPEIFVTSDNIDESEKIVHQMKKVSLSNTTVPSINLRPESHVGRSNSRKQMNSPKRSQSAINASNMDEMLSKSSSKQLHPSATVRRPTTRSARRNFINDPRCTGLLNTLEPKNKEMLREPEEVKETIDKIFDEFGHPDVEEASKRAKTSGKVCVAHALDTLYGKKKRPMQKIM